MAGTTRGGVDDGKPFADPTTSGDRVRMRLARACAREAVEGASRRYLDETEAAFRAEMSLTVRSISSLALAAIAADGLSVDEVLRSIAQPLGWARRRGGIATGVRGTTSTRSSPKSGADVRPSTPWFRCAGGRARLFVAEHSIELLLRVGGVEIRTERGIADVRLEGLPDSIGAAMVGRRLSDLVAHPLIEAMDLVVVALGEPVGSDRSPLLVVASGVQPCHLT